jgi:hypothetical protein
MSAPVTPNPQSLDQITKATGLGAFIIGGSTQGGGTQWGQTVDGSTVASMTMGGLPNILSGGLADIPMAIEKITELLLTLPLEVLQAMQQIIPGAIPEQFIDVATSVETIMSAIATPVFTLFDTFTQFVQTILSALTGGLLGGDLTNLMEKIPVIGQLFAGLTDFTGLLGNPTGLGTGSPGLPDASAIPLLGPVLSQITSVINTLFQSFLGLVPSLGSFPDLMTALQNALTSIPFLNVVGLGGPGDIGGSMQSTWDQWIGGLVGAAPGTGGAGLADLFNIGNLFGSKASQGSNAWSILGIRTNKSIDSGTLATSASNIPLSKIAMQSTAPTVPVTQSSTIINFHRVAESSPLGAVRWLGSGNTNLTDFRVNIWKMDTTTGDLSLAHNSANIIGSIAPANTTPQRHTYSLPTPIAVKASEVYGVELVPVGAGTHNVAGTANWVPHDTATFPRNYAATRNVTTPGSPPATIPAASVTYSNNVTFSEIAIDAGTGVDVHDPEPLLLTQIGTQTVPIPDWANFVDVVPLGSGGGGHQGGTWGVSGGGGYSGGWNGATWARGTDFTGSAIITIVVPDGGAKNSGDGSATTASIPGHSVSGAGGQGNDNYTGGGVGSVGQGAYTYTYNGNTFTAGGDQNSFGANGTPPGGGGAGGNYVSFQSGGKGGPGACWLIFRQH